VQVRQYGLNT
jgi:hypothetical protein